MGAFFFGLQDARDELTRNTHPALKKLFHDLEMHHHPLARDARHPLYRAQPERWFESLVLEDVTRIDAMLDPRLV